VKLIAANVAQLISDNGQRTIVTQRFESIPQTDASGGMTLDMGNGPIVVCLGKMSLADEKALRVDLRVKLNNPKIKLSRTNDVKIRVSQYDVAETANDWRKMFGKDKPRTEKKAEATPPVQGPVEKNGTLPVPVK
jgi:hypothetical protein